MGFWRGKDAGASPDRSDDVRAGVIRRLKTPKMDAGSAAPIEGHRGVGDHVWWGGTAGRCECRHVKTYRVCAA